MPSARLHHWVIAKCLETERKLGRMLGPFVPDLIDHRVVQANRIAVIPKGQTGKWRLITDRSLSYTTVERVAQRAMWLGRRAQMAKVDIESAYRLIPVHTQDHPLFRIVWEGITFIDPMLHCAIRAALSAENLQCGG